VTLTEVDRLLAAHERSGTMGALCIRYEADASGRPVPTACLRPRRAPLSSRIALVALAAVAIGFVIYVPLPLRDDLDEEVRDVCEFPAACPPKPAPVRHLGGCPPGDPMCE
jgi:hypothetical protein